MYLPFLLKVSSPRIVWAEGYRNNSEEGYLHLMLN